MPMPIVTIVSIVGPFLCLIYLMFGLLEHKVTQQRLNKDYSEYR